MVAMLSIHTAVGWLATRAMAAPLGPPTALAAVMTSADQSGLTYPVAPLYGLSTCGQAGEHDGGGLPVGEPVGLGVADALGGFDGLGEPDGDRDGDGDIDGDGGGDEGGGALTVHRWLVCGPQSQICSRAPFHEPPASRHLPVAMFTTVPSELTRQFWPPLSMQS